MIRGNATAVLFAGLAWLSVVPLAVPGAARGTAFDDFVSPVSNPVNFEDPRSTTEIRPLYVYHRIANTFPLAGTINGGDVHGAGAQARVAVTDRLSLIATKGGYVWLRPQDDFAVAGQDVVAKNSGVANLAFGAKYAVYVDSERRAMATLGLRYEAPSGDNDVQQGKVFALHLPGVDLAKRGDGVLNPFLTGLWGIGNAHVLAYAGGRIALDGLDSSFFDLSLHADYKIGKLYPLIEMNWVQVLDAGTRLVPAERALGIKLRQEGFDVVNLGAPSANHGVVTLALGARYRLVDGIVLAGKAGGVDVGATYELPISNSGDLFGWRVTSDLIIFLR